MSRLSTFVAGGCCALLLAVVWLVVTGSAEMPLYFDAVGCMTWVGVGGLIAAGWLR